MPSKPPEDETAEDREAREQREQREGKNQEGEQRPGTRDYAKPLPGDQPATPAEGADADQAAPESGKSGGQNR